VFRAQALWLCCNSAHKNIAVEQPPITRSITVEKPWLSRYPTDVPEFINPDQYLSLVEMFEQSVHKYADQPAFMNMGSVMTFRKLEERSRAFAAYL
jgi:hypothetical protein